MDPQFDSQPIQRPEDNSDTPRHSDAQLELANEVIHTLHRTVKTLCLYPEDNPQSITARKKFHSQITAYLSEYLRLDLEVHPRELILKGEKPERLVEAESLLSVKCHEAGITEISFMHPFPESSASSLFSIIRSCLSSEREYSDFAEALWGEQLEGFEYEVVDDLQLVDYDETLREEYFLSSPAGNNEEVFRQTCDKLFAESHSAEPTEPIQDPEAFEKVINTLRDEDGQRSSQEVELPSPRSFVERSFQLTDFETRSVRQYLERDALFDTSQAMYELTVDLLNDKQELVDFVETLDVSLRMHTDLIERGFVRLAAKVVRLIRASADRYKETFPVWARKANEALAAISSRERLQRVAEALNKLESVSGAEFGEYLHVFNWTAYSGLTDMLGILQHKNHRLALCAFLSEADDEHIDLLASGIYDKRWYVVRNAVNILFEFNTPRAHKHLQKALTHSDLRIRELILTRCTTQDPGFACKALETLISDADESIRDRALKLALEQTGKDARKLFEKLVREKTLSELSPEHQQLVLNGYALTGGDEALQSLAERAGKWSLLESTTQQTRRNQFIEAIAISQSDLTQRTLKKLSRSWNGNIKKAAKAALKNRQSEDHPSMASAEISRAVNEEDDSQ